MSFLLVKCWFMYKNQHFLNLILHLYILQASSCQCNIQLDIFQQ